MACLLPQFKCPQDTLSTHLKTHSNNNNNSNSNLLKTREPPVSRAVCVMSMTLAMATTTTSTIVDVENLQLHELEAHSNSIRPLTSIGSMDLSQKSNFEATLATETLLTGEEATIAAAAAEAVALAKAAVEIAHDVTLMIKNNPSMRSDSMSSERTTETDFIQFKRVQLSKMDQASISGTETSSDGRSEKFSLLGFDEMETADDGPKLPQPHLSSSIEVWSRRQRERIARRGRPTAKAASTVVSVKSESTGRKKRTASQDLDFSDPLHYLKATAGTSRLLTATEETKLSEGIQDMLKLQKLREEVSKRCEGPLTFAQWATAAGIDQKTLRRRLNYGQLCKEKMVKSNIRLVISIAKNYQGAGMNLQDLVQEGCRGLVKGTERFDASKGFKFSTYAHWWIRQAVRKSLSERARTIRLPFHMVEATYRVKEAKKQLYSDTGKHPSNEEVAAATGLSMKRLMAVLLTPKAPISLDQKFGFMDLKPSEVTADPNAETSEDLMMRQFMKQDLKKVLDSLSPRESQVVRMRFGLEDGRMRTLHEIGELIGVSRERIRQIESCAFRKLKHTKRSKNLQQYLIP